MKIFPLKPLSTYDRIRNIFKIMTQNQTKIQSIESDIAIFGGSKQQKKGRSICNMLSE